MRRALLAAILALASAPSPALATVTTSTRTQPYTCAGESSFTIPFPFVSIAHITVTKTLDSTGVDVTPFAQNTAYTVTRLATGQGGTVTTTAACASGYTLTITRTVPVTQTTNFSGQSSFRPQTHEDAFDKLTMIAQQLQAAAGTSGQTAVDTHEAAADPHAQYALLAGRAAGQTLIGSTASGGSLAFNSTSHATKGNITFGSAGTELVVDDVNNRVGIGDATPDYTLDLEGGSAQVGLDNLFEASGLGGLVKTVDSGVLALSGSVTGTTTPFAYIHIYGVSHATRPLDIWYNGSNHEWFDADGNGLMTLDPTDLSLATGISFGIGDTTPDAELDVVGEVIVAANTATAAGITTTGNTSGAGIAATGGATGAGVTGTGGATSGYGVQASADTDTPASAALHLVPQNANPTVPAQGNLYVNSGDGSLRYYNGTAWSALGTVSTIKLTGDVTDSSGNATYTDCTGLSFAVTSGTTYNFRATIFYDSAALTTGIGLAVSGPAFSRLGYHSRTATAATTESSIFAVAYDAATHAASVATTANVATLTGTVTPSANGTLAVRFATEIDTSAVICKAGSLLEYW